MLFSISITVFFLDLTPYEVSCANAHAIQIIFAILLLAVVLYSA